MRTNCPKEALIQNIIQLFSLCMSVNYFHSYRNGERSRLLGYLENELYLG